MSGRQAYSTAITPADDGDAIVSGTAELPDPDIYPPTIGRTPAFAPARCEGG